MESSSEPRPRGVLEFHQDLIVLSILVSVEHACLGIWSIEHPDSIWHRFNLSVQKDSHSIRRANLLPSERSSGKVLWIKANIRRFSTAYRGSTVPCSSKGHQEAWIGLPGCSRQLEHCRDRLKDPTYMCSCRAGRYVCSCGLYQSA